MRETLGVLAYLALPVIGWAVVRLPALRRMSVDGRLSAATATGALILSVLMAVMSLLHVPWTRTLLFTALAAIAFAGVMSARSAGRLPAYPARPLPTMATALALAIAAYAALSARMTSGDLSFFWAPKGIFFFRARGIDVAFLRTPDYFLMHTDYPPLQPLVYAWSNLVSRHFAWFAAVFASVLFLACIVGIVRATARDDYGGLLVASILGYTFVHNYIGGGADPLLLLYEALTLSALTFLPPGRSQGILAAIGMAGAVWTKVEGAPFVIAVAIAVLLVQPRQARRLTLMVLPAAVLLGAWIGFAAHESMLDAYTGASKRLHLSAIPPTLAQLIAHARLDALWLPWLAPVALIAIGPKRRRAMIPLLVSALSVAATVYFYIHEPDAANRTFWIASSANRTLLPPLMAICIAAVAAGPGPGDFGPAELEDRPL